jgi:hypothetical protein
VKEKNSRTYIVVIGLVGVGQDWLANNKKHSIK